MILPVILGQAVIFGSATAVMAYRKDRDVVAWFLAGFLFSLFGLVTICCLPRRQWMVDPRVRRAYSEQMPPNKDLLHCAICGRELSFCCTVLRGWNRVCEALLCGDCDFQYRKLDEAHRLRHGH